MKSLEFNLPRSFGSAAFLYAKMNNNVQYALSHGILDAGKPENQIQKDKSRMYEKHHARQVLDADNVEIDRRCIIVKRQGLVPCRAAIV